MLDAPTPKPRRLPTLTARGPLEALSAYGGCVLFVA